MLKEFILFNEHIIPKKDIVSINKGDIKLGGTFIFSIHLRFYGDSELIASCDTKKEREERFAELVRLLCDE